MSSGSSLPYQLRPNKTADRELFLGLLSRIGAHLTIERYTYIGLGGPFLEDFRLIHARLGLKRMFCVESQAEVHLRQKFNRPVDCVECVPSTVENFLDGYLFEDDAPVIVWLDYTDPKKLTQQIQRYANMVAVVPIGSILRVTLNANPASLGEPDANKTAVSVGNQSVDARQKALRQYRLGRFRERLRSLFPNELNDDDMTHRRFGNSVLRALKLAVEKERLGVTDRNIIWALATHYADGQPMVTATLVVCATDDATTPALLQEWEFYSQPDAPHLLAMPTLSTLERLTLERSSDVKTEFEFVLPSSDMKEDPIESFRKWYRIYPHFSRVEL